MQGGEKKVRQSTCCLYQDNYPDKNLETKTLLPRFLIGKGLQPAWGHTDVKLVRICPQGLRPQKNSSTVILNQEQIALPVSFGNRQPSVSNINMAASSTKNKLRTVNRRDVAQVKIKNFMPLRKPKMENFTTEEELQT